MRPSPGRPRGRKGVTTKIRVNRQRQAQSYIGFLNQNDGSVDLVRLQWQNTATIIDALRQLVERHPGKRIVVVWDNAAWHKTTKLRQLLGPGKPLEKIHLIWLPAYSPDRNPIEHVWGEAKNHIANQQHLYFNHTRQQFETYITTNTFPYRI